MFKFFEKIVNSATTKNSSPQQELPTHTIAKNSISCQGAFSAVDLSFAASLGLVNASSIAISSQNSSNRLLAAADPAKGCIHVFGANGVYLRLALAPQKQQSSSSSASRDPLASPVSNSLCVIKMSFCLDSQQNLLLVAACRSPSALYVWELFSSSSSSSRQSSAATSSDDGSSSSSFSLFPRTCVRLPEAPTTMALQTASASTAASPSSSFAFIGTNEGSVLIVNIESGMLGLYRIKIAEFAYVRPTKEDIPPDVVAAIPCPTDNRQILLASDDGNLVLWDLKARKVAKRFFAPDSDSKILTCAAWKSCGKQFALGHADGTVTIWEVKNQSPQKRLFITSNTLTPSSSSAAAGAAAAIERLPVMDIAWVCPSSSEDEKNDTILVAGGTVVATGSEDNRPGGIVFKFNPNGNAKKSPGGGWLPCGLIVDDGNDVVSQIVPLTRAASSSSSPLETLTYAIVLGRYRGGEEEKSRSDLSPSLSFPIINISCLDIIEEMRNGQILHSSSSFLDAKSLYVDRLVVVPTAKPEILSALRSGSVSDGKSSEFSALFQGGSPAPAPGPWPSGRLLVCDVGDRDAQLSFWEMLTPHSIIPHRVRIHSPEFLKQNRGRFYISVDASILVMFGIDRSGVKAAVLRFCSSPMPRPLIHLDLSAKDVEIATVVESAPPPPSSNATTTTTTATTVETPPQSVESVVDASPSAAAAAPPPPAEPHSLVASSTPASSSDQPSSSTPETVTTAAEFEPPAVMSMDDLDEQAKQEKQEEGEQEKEEKEEDQVGETPLSEGMLSQTSPDNLTMPSASERLMSTDTVDSISKSNSAESDISAVRVDPVVSAPNATAAAAAVADTVADDDVSSPSPAISEPPSQKMEQHAPELIDYSPGYQPIFSFSSEDAVTTTMISVVAKRVFVGFESGKVAIFDLETCSLLSMHPLSSNIAPIVSIAPVAPFYGLSSSDSIVPGVLAGDRNGSLAIFNVTSGELVVSSVTSHATSNSPLVWIGVVDAAAIPFVEGRNIDLNPSISRSSSSSAQAAADEQQQQQQQQSEATQQVAKFAVLVEEKKIRVSTLPFSPSDIHKTNSVFPISSCSFINIGDFHGLVCVSSEGRVAIHSLLSLEVVFQSGSVPLFPPRSIDFTLNIALDGWIVSFDEKRGCFVSSLLSNQSVPSFSQPLLNEASIENAKNISSSKTKKPSGGASVLKSLFGSGDVDYAELFSDYEKPVEVAAEKTAAARSAKSAASAAGEAHSAVAEARDALIERGEKLSTLQIKMQTMQDEAQSFHQKIAEYNRKQAAKKWYEL